MSEFSVEECRKHCPNYANSATGQWLELALKEIERLRGVKAKQNEPAIRDKRKPPVFDLNDVGQDEGDVEEALALAEEIEDLAGQLPEEGSDFGDSVSEKAADIAANIEAHGRVTDAQYTALENMLDGLQRWFHD